MAGIGVLGGDPQSALDCAGGSAILQGKLEEADHSSGNWYFPREEVERNSPSLADGIDTKRETYLRKSYCTFLQDLGMRLKVPQMTIATAITFCHRFYLRQSHALNDRFMIATVCMFLAGKVEETPRMLKDVIQLSYSLKNKKDPTAASRIKQKNLYNQQKELLLYGERLVLTTLGFDLNVHHPYKPLVAAIKKFEVSQNALAQVAWNFVNDGLRTSLCLQFRPHHIAAGAIFLAAKFLKIKLPNDGDKQWWQEFDVNPRQLEDVSNQMLELYEQNKGPLASRSDELQAAATPNGVCRREGDSQAAATTVAPAVSAPRYASQDVAEVREEECNPESGSEAADRLLQNGAAKRKRWDNGQQQDAAAAAAAAAAGAYREHHGHEHQGNNSYVHHSRNAAADRRPHRSDWQEKDAKKSRHK